MKPNKFFSLIQGGQVALAPGKKIIPSSEIEEILSAAEIKEKTLRDSEEFLEKMKEQCQKEEKKAMEEAFAKGMQDWAEQIALLSSEIEGVGQKVQSMVVPLALKAAQKILGRELEVNKEAVVDIIKNSVKSVSQNKNIKIYVSREDFPFVEKNKEELKRMFDALEGFSIQEKSTIESGSCMIETEAGIINAQLSKQWEALEKAFKKILLKESTQ